MSVFKWQTNATRDNVQFVKQHTKHKAGAHNLLW